MTKVITYGTYDLLHYGHIRLLERAKALGDYLIVGITTDDFDISRGKINVQQSLIERIEAVRATGLADEIIVEEYEGQKIDDIQKYRIDIFTVGSDWRGKFDYLKEFCNVIYLDRTEGVSSSEIRSNNSEIRIGLIGSTNSVKKFATECNYVNGAIISGWYTIKDNFEINGVKKYNDIESLIDNSDAVYVASHPTKHYDHILKALFANKHVIYESPIALDINEAKELFAIANKKHLILYAGIKTAYTIAYARMVLMAKTGKIGKIVSVDSVCTSLEDLSDQMLHQEVETKWNSICDWGPTAMLPVFQLLGTNYKSRNIISSFKKGLDNFDTFTKIDWVYPNAVASIKVGKGVKAEGQLIIAGTKGYIYIPAPWWKTDYFEIRYEDQTKNKRFFYQLDGEGIRNMIVHFVKSITQNKIVYIPEYLSEAISETIGAVLNNNVGIII